jgi:hypothetical protein
MKNKRLAGHLEPEISLLGKRIRAYVQPYFGPPHPDEANFRGANVFFILTRVEATYVGRTESDAKVDIISFIN